VVVLRLHSIGHSNGTVHWDGYRNDAGPGTWATGTAAIRHKLFRNRCAA